MHRLLTTTAVLVAAGAFCIGCGGDDDEGSEQTFESILKPPSEAENGFSYDAALAPDESELKVILAQGDDSTSVILEAKGLQKNRGYAAHLHNNPCGLEPDDAGPHFQHEVDPRSGPNTASTDPAFANKDNEFWLDFRTNGKGDGQSGTTVPFTLEDERKPRSLVVHAEEETATAPGKAGSAGGRVACLDVDLK